MYLHVAPNVLQSTRRNLPASRRARAAGNMLITSVPFVVGLREANFPGQHRLARDPPTDRDEASGY